MFLRSFEIFAKPSKLLTVFHPSVQTGRSPAWVIVSLCVTMCHSWSRKIWVRSHRLLQTWNYRNYLDVFKSDVVNDLQLKPGMICLDLQFTRLLSIAFTLVLDRNDVAIGQLWAALAVSAVSDQKERTLDRHWWSLTWKPDTFMCTCFQSVYQANSYLTRPRPSKLARRCLGCKVSLSFLA